MDTKEAKLVQEWLCLHRHGVVVDGISGPATRAALKQFQEKAGLRLDGQATDETMEALIAPLKRATQLAEVGDRPFNELVLQCAKMHLAEHPREIGGQNRGPWVRYYMDGHEGQKWAWCVGFVRKIVQQACDSARVQNPLIETWRSDPLGNDAKKRGALVTCEQVFDDFELLIPGYLFLDRHGTKKNDWDHIGIVTGKGGDVIGTIEGNTNDEGSAEGYEVCSRLRSIAGKDFVRL